jgi:universal stress protein A
MVRIGFELGPDLVAETFVRSLFLAHPLHTRMIQSRHNGSAQMKIKKILCPVDFSDFNQAANVYASVLAHANEAEIIYLHILQPDVPYGSYVYINLEKESERERKQLEEIKPTIATVKASYVIEPGSPTTRIVEYAEENDVDMIVMGTHGRTGLGRVLMGSIAEAVVRKAECPVLALKPNTKVPLPA